MAGLGRRTHYRKHLTDEVLYDFPEPGENERIAKVMATRGGNQFDILLAKSTNDPEYMSSRTSQLAFLPTKFRKLVWLKRNDYVIVETGVEDDEDTKGIRYKIAHILFKQQVQHLQNKGLWPTSDPEFAQLARENSVDVKAVTDLDEDDGIVYDNIHDDNLFVNTNRIANLAVQDSSSEEQSDEES